jgi:hypothetical protein
MKKVRTDAYMFTADPLCVSDMQMIERVRKTIKAVNKQARQTSTWKKEPAQLFRVCLKARLGKGNPVYAKYKDQYIKSIKLEDARTIDVYVQRR